MIREQRFHRNTHTPLLQHMTPSADLWLTDHPFAMKFLQALFDPYQSIKDTFEQNPFQCDLQNQNVLFMRWKEHFLVPDHRVEGIPGASFEGFYYICYNKSTGDIEGYYYHKTSER